MELCFRSIDEDDDDDIFISYPAAAKSTTVDHKASPRVTPSDKSASLTASTSLTTSATVSLPTLASGLSPSPAVPPSVPGPPGYHESYAISRSKADLPLPASSERTSFSFRQQCWNRISSCPRCQSTELFHFYDASADRFHIRCDAVPSHVYKVMIAAHSYIF